jgi:hypothetical protein
MKYPKCIISFIILVGLLLSVNSEVLADDMEPFVSVYDMGFTVEYVKAVDSVISERNTVLKPSRRDTKLIEVKLVGEIHKDGQAGLFPSVFSAVFYWRGVPKILPSIAVGRKRMLSDGLEEYWLHLPEASMILGFEKGEKIIIYTLFEIPKDAVKLQVQIPALMPQEFLSPDQ